MSKWIAYGSPITCAACQQPVPNRDNRIQVQIGKDGNLYCYDTNCEQDVLEARVEKRRGAS